MFEGKMPQRDTAKNQDWHLFKQTKRLPMRSRLNPGKAFAAEKVNFF